MKKKCLNITLLSNKCMFCRNFCTVNHPPQSFVSDFCHAGNCPPHVHVTLKSLERIMATAFWLLIIIIHMLNTIACVAVNEMVQLLFEYYRDIQSRGHFLPTNIKI